MDEDSSFSKAARPLIEYLAKNHHPHTKVIVDSTSAECLEGTILVRTEEYLVD